MTKRPPGISAMLKFLACPSVAPINQNRMLAFRKFARSRSGSSLP